jgi:sucrose-6-phosphate hydrolase SacC (GH32 family)
MLWAHDGLTSDEQQTAGFANWETLPREVTITATGLQFQPIAELSLYEENAIHLHNVKVDNGVYQISLPEGLERQFVISVRDENVCNIGSKAPASLYSVFFRMCVIFCSVFPV